MSEPFIGQIVMFAGNFAPRGWAFCDGQYRAISEHTALFSILGTTYGGDGRTTFALPDLRGRVPAGEGIGPGVDPVSLGQRSGASKASLTISNLPSHNHTAAFSGSATLRVSSESADTDDQDGMAIAKGDFYTDNDVDTDLRDGSIDMSSANVSVGNTGASQPFSIMQPFLGVNYIIAIEGLYPARSER